MSGDGRKPGILGGKPGSLLAVHSSAVDLPTWLYGRECMENRDLGRQCGSLRAEPGSLLAVHRSAVYVVVWERMHGK